jgi:hypothetical protein
VHKWWGKAEKPGISKAQPGPVERQKWAFARAEAAICFGAQRVRVPPACRPCCQDHVTYVTWSWQQGLSG